MSVNLLRNYPATQGTDLKVQSLGLQSKTSAEINALSATPGQLTFNSDNNNVEYYDGANWNQIYSSAQGSIPYSVFRARSNAPQVQTAGTGTVIFSAVSVNEQNGVTGQYSTVNNRFTVSLPGIYQFNHTSVYQGQTGTVDNCVFSIIKNNGDILDSSQLPAAIAVSDPARIVHLSASDMCNAGDFINIQVEFTTSDSGQLLINSGGSYFSGCLVTYIPV